MRSARDTRPCGTEPLQRALAAEHHERLEQRGTDGATRRGDAHRRLRLAELQPDALPQHLERRLERVGIPRCVGVGLDRAVEDDGRRVGLHHLVPRRGVDRGFLEEDEIHHGGHFDEPGDACLHEGRHRLEGPPIELLGMPRCVGRDQPGLAPLHELVHRHRSDVLAVERFELLDVEERRGRVHVLEAEQPGELVERHDLLVSGRCPPQEHQVVAHRLGQVPLVAIQLERYGVATLGQLLPLLVDEHWHVREHRQLAAVERAPEQQSPSACWAGAPRPG